MNILAISLSVTAIALIAVGGFAAVQTTRLSAAHSNIETLEESLAAEKQITASQRLTIDSMGRSQARREGDGEEKDGLKGDINETTPTNLCSRSEPIGIALDGLSDTREKDSANPDP